MNDKEMIKSFCFIKHEAEIIDGTILQMEDLPAKLWRFRLLTLQEKVNNISEEVEKMLDAEAESEVEE